MLAAKGTYLSKHWVLVSKQSCGHNEARTETVDNNTFGFRVGIQSLLEFPRE